MTNEERLAKNIRIRERSKKTKQKRKSQIYRVFRVKIDFSHLSEAQRVRLKMLFVEAKWLYNDIITFSHDNDINDYDTKTTCQSILSNTKLHTDSMMSII